MPHLPTTLVAAHYRLFLGRAMLHGINVRRSALRRRLMEMLMPIERESDG